MPGETPPRLEGKYLIFLPFFWIPSLKGLLQFIHFLLCRNCKCFSLWYFCCHLYVYWPAVHVHEYPITCFHRHSSFCATLAVYISCWPAKKKKKLLISFLVSDRVRLGKILRIDLHGIKVQVLWRLPVQHNSHLVIRKMRREKDCYIPEE